MTRNGIGFWRQCFVSAVLWSSFASAQAARPTDLAVSLPPPASDAGFCQRAQQLLARTSLKPANIVFTTTEGFIRSKPRVKPFETDQFVSYGDAAGSHPIRVSCKMKSSDHLRAVYGAEAAGAEGWCRDVNRDTAARVYSSLTAAERSRLVVSASQLVLEDDVMARTGSSFTRGTDRVWTDETGRLHLQALAIRVDWNDWLWRWMPDRFRGQHSCHFIAPEYLRALVLGETKTPASAGVP